MEADKSSVDLPVIERPLPGGAATVALVGNPNAGKTSLFNRLTGQRAHTANFSGTTIEHRRGVLKPAPAAPLRTEPITLVDLPGMYSLEATSPEEEVACSVLRGCHAGEPAPDAVVIVVDATNLERNLPLAREALGLGKPTIVALNMSDLADRLGLKLDLARLSSRVGCPVVRVSARTGEGIDSLVAAVHALADQKPLPQLDAAACACTSCNGCGYASRFDWAESVRADSLTGDLGAPSRLTDSLDTVLTHRFGGLVAFAVVMFALFMTIFSVATVPMDLIDALFGWAGDTVGGWLPDGDLKSLLVDGVIGGVGGMLVFLPQICLLFFLLALLEDSGYLARAALVMDRLMQRVGLPGKAFVPMLSAHACAIPAIMSTRVIDDRRDRLVTILVAPLLSCSARVPVYVMVVAMLFPDRPGAAAATFAGAYALGIVAALGAAFVFKRTLLKGESRPLVIELPNYRAPSIRDALLRTVDQAWQFVQNAGTTILVISIVLWALATYPKTDPADLPTDDALAAQTQLENSFAGRIGRTIQPVFAPLGFDWKTSVGVVSSFAAREVVVSTLSILYGLGEDGDQEKLLGAMQSSQRADGTPVFTTATCLSLLVFYVLAMQCLPTQVVTRRETGSWNWALLQLGYMSVLAYGAALVTYQVANWLA
ncbi:Ferrous iron transport protein B [Botrimarina colliarenosi]|uniref:Ferrous iron transport protein B n=1 Tax=Botrimarina colliarenosi TaxID=2528001 RepID=A0A5C6AKM6_9BACT|nr:ferrous iron transport protein B [Botrimarina colliarenosi]TWT99818.1 Ferrous iron transport protein B [Botrimarina colliarenosi]